MSKSEANPMPKSMPEAMAVKEARIGVPFADVVCLNEGMAVIGMVGNAGAVAVAVAIA